MSSAGRLYRITLPPQIPLDDVVTEYSVDGNFYVRIGRDQTGRYVYNVEIPPPPEGSDLYRLEEALNYLITQIDVYRQSYNDAYNATRLEYRLTPDEMLYIEMWYKMIAEGYYIMEPLVRDPAIEEIDVRTLSSRITGMYTHSFWVVHSSRTVPVKWLITNILMDRELLDIMIEHVASRTGSVLSVDNPIIETTTPEGYRATLVKENVNMTGGIITIRKKLGDLPLITDLIRGGTLSPLIYAYLWILLKHRKLVLITGETGSGKTTLLRSILLALGGMKVVTVEDTPEIDLCDRDERGRILWCVDNWQPLKTTHVHSGKIDLTTLVKTTLRLRPDVVVVGEIRGEEAADLVQAASTGHSALATMHGRTPKDILARLAHPPMNVGISYMLGMGALVTISYLAHLKSRRVIRVDEVTRSIDQDTGLPMTVEVFKYDYVGDRHLPDNAEEVVSKSFLLREIGEELYEAKWLKYMSMDLRLRAELIDERIIQRGLKSVTAIAQEMSRIDQEVLDHIQLEITRATPLG